MPGPLSEALERYGDLCDELAAALEAVDGDFEGVPKALPHIKRALAAAERVAELNRPQRPARSRKAGAA